MKKPRQISHNGLMRRGLLRSIGAISLGAALPGPTQILFEAILNGIVSKAHAQSLDPRRYLYIQQAGAPSRWTFDLFLTPYSTDFMANGMLGTRYTNAGGRYTGVEYSTITRMGLRIPHMWQFEVPKAGGGTRPMTDLLANMIQMRGINTGNAGHPGSQLLHFRPLGATQSTGALSGDASDAPLPGVNISANNYSYLSKAGKSAVNLGSSGNIIQNLLNPFIGRSPASFRANKDKLKDAIKLALNDLDEHAINQHEEAIVIAESRKGAEELLEAGFGNLTTVWNQLLGKYRTLIQRAIDPSQSIPGINDRPIGATGVRNGTYNLNTFSNRVTMADLRGLITTNTQIQFMAEHFAAAEYVLVNDLSSSVTISPRQMFRLGTAGNAAPSSRFDEHNSGRMTILYLNTMYNRALSSCLLELIDQLKAKGIWNDTVIDVGGEFNRSARTNGTGSDHGFQGASATLYSGAIEEPFVVGNIRRNAGGGVRPGTWGYGSSVKELGQTLNMGHFAASLAFLLRTPPPLTSAQSVIGMKSGKVAPLIELAKQT